MNMQIKGDEMGPDIERIETEFAATMFDSDPWIIEFMAKLDKTFADVKAYLESGDDNAPWDLQGN
jgi:hypothetical protein